jgi:prepilin-type N-terminal cleavage/methylation domain-containing protein
MRSIKTEAGGKNPSSQMGSLEKAFTLLELLIVVGIIGILTALGLPAIKGLTQTNVNVAAHRQMLDDINYARLRAINDRSTVFIVFLPSDSSLRSLRNAEPPQILVADKNRLENLIPTGEFSSYAIVSSRTVGDQPGRPTPRYLTGWRQLPQGMIFSTYKFNNPASQTADDRLRPFGLASVPFPSSQSAPRLMPAIGFNSRGQLISGRDGAGRLVSGGNVDEVIALIRGTIFFPLNNQGEYRLNIPPDLQTIPPNPRINDDYHFIRINWLTGRAQVEMPTIRPVL